MLREGAARRRHYAPPIQMCAPKGSFYLRDDRCWHRGVANTSDRPRHIVQLSYRAAEVRHNVIHGSTLNKNRATPEEIAASKSDTHWTDSFERFHTDCEAMLLATPSKHGVDRNFGFRKDVVLPSIARELQVDEDGEVVRRLPMPMPESVRGNAWAEEMWPPEQRGGAKL